MKTGKKSSVSVPETNRNKQINEAGGYFIIHFE